MPLNAHVKATEAVATLTDAWRAADTEAVSVNLLDRSPAANQAQRDDTVPAPLARRSSVARGRLA
jgi:hypothetical protein